MAAMNDAEAATPPLLTVVVCTYNRAQLLESCLCSLIQQSAPSNAFEILVIDNGSTDETHRVVSKFQRAYRNVRLEREGKLGLSSARNRGWRSASGDFVAYLDDDARATPGWISAICAFIQRMPDAVAFGGPYVAIYESPKPKWYKDEYGSWSLGDVERPLRAKEYLKGTNMIFKKAIFAEVGGFAEGLGMVGAAISYGEETNFDRKLKALGKQIYYVPTIVVGHLVLSHKMSVRWMLAASFKNGLAGPATFDTPRNIGKALLGLLKLCALGAWHVVFADEAYLQNRVFKALRGVVRQAGVVVAMVRHRDDFSGSR